MKKSELRQMIKEELLKEYENQWVTPLNIQWHAEGSGLYKVVLSTNNGSKKITKTLSDSMPNDFKTLNNLILGVIKFMEHVRD